MLPGFPGLPDREQACWGSEPVARPGSRHLAVPMETAVRLRTDSHGNSGGRPCWRLRQAWPLSPSSLCSHDRRPGAHSVQMAGGGRGGLAPPTRPTAGGGGSPEHRGRGDLLPPQIHRPGTRAPTMCREPRQLPGRPHKPPSQEARCREGRAGSPQAPGVGTGLQSSKD